MSKSDFSNSLEKLDYVTIIDDENERESDSYVLYVMSIVTLTVMCSLGIEI